MLSTDLRSCETGTSEKPRVTVTWKLVTVLSHPSTILRLRGFGTFSRTCEPVWNLRFRLVSYYPFSSGAGTDALLLFQENKIGFGFLGWISSRSLRSM